MKLVFALALFALSSNAFAGAYSLSCSNKEKTVVISQDLLLLGKGAQAKYDQTDSIYFADPVQTKLFMSQELQSFLQASNPKYFIERPDSVNNKDNKIKTISKKTFKDECGHPGETEKFKSLYRVLDMQGNEVVPPTELTCISRAINGHCT